MIKHHVKNDSVWVGLSRCSSITHEQSESYGRLLSSAELARNQRYRFARDRHRDLVARALLRSALGGLLDTRPEDVEFEIGAKGKPHLKDKSEPQRAIDQPALPFFNLSHSADWVVLAVANFPVGIDIEFTQRKNNVLAIARNYFFGREVEQLFSLPFDQQRERFFDYWTLKEAYMKARGEGIALGLSNFGFQLCDSGRISLYLSSSIDDTPADWKFSCLTPELDYRLSIAAKTPADLRPIFQEVIPLVSLTDLAW
ncbi:MAG: 4'-phosphopantetheinyl transferase superfamily protein [Pseudomonadales bacterium]|nr:4'-phosphopantetheinyl transferase superfamily protein [Pseudomonadales bacterium]